MKLLGALFLVSLAVSNLRTCEAGGKMKVKIGVGHAYGKRKQLDESHAQTVDMDHFNVTLENNELLHQLLSLMNSSSSTCTTASEPKPDSSSSTCTTASEPNSYPMDCSDIFADGQCDQSGIYEIFPLRDQLKQPLKVLCDMEDGGGWTVFLLRNNASEHVNFTRNWNGYKEFFGSADQEYWIGLENLHALTSSNRTYEVRFEAKAPELNDTWQGYKSFSVASEENEYQLNLGEYDERSNIGEYSGFGFNNGGNFSTIENDNDLYSTFNEADRFKGGWWYTYGCNICPTAIHGKSDGLKVGPWANQNFDTGFPNWLQIKIRPTKQ